MESKGSASMPSTTITAAAVAHRVFRTSVAQVLRRAEPTVPVGCRPGTRRLLTRGPSSESTAGSRVSAAAAVNATSTAAPTAIPVVMLTPSISITSSARTTMVPASSTARPDVLTAPAAASSGLRPSASRPRKRDTMNSE